MVKNTIRIGENRYRETFGRHYEDFKVGDIYEHRPGRTITETDNIWFSLLTMNTHPLHFNREYAKHSEFGRCIVSGPLIISIMVGMSVSDISQQGIANLGWDDIRLIAPVYPGDTLYAESEVIKKRKSASRPNQGIVVFKTLGYNQSHKLICSYLRKLLIPFHGYSVDDKILALEQQTN